MTREEFEQTVRTMQDQGVPLTMANLMVRTELPRAQIEAWLDAMQRDVRFKPPAAAGPTDEPSSAPGEGLLARARALQREVVGDAASAALKNRLGLGGDRDGAAPRREVKRGAVLGLIAPPAGLLYSAPWKIGGIGTAAYAALAYVAIAFPMLGIPYLLIPAHLVGGVLGGAYAWRYNHRGRRAGLLPSGKGGRDDE